MKLLLVEDHAFLAEVTRNMLREMYDHEVEHAATATKALEIAERNNFDLILIDLNLPDMDGYELAAELRKIDSLNRTILVALTGIGNFVDTERATAAGFDACFTKPMDFSVLETLVRRQ